MSTKNWNMAPGDTEAGNDCGCSAIGVSASSSFDEEPSDR